MARKKLTRAQLNVEVLKVIAKLMREDARKHNRSVCGIAETVLGDFYALKESQRLPTIMRSPAKALGRKTT